MRRSDDPGFLGMVELTNRIRTRAISAVEATQATLRRIELRDPRLKSFVLVTPDLALEQARQVDAEIRQGLTKGPLHGAPIAVKDLCCTNGIPTAAGMPLHREFRPTEDATVVRRLREAGAILLGKLQLTEGAFADHHPDVPPPVNPWNAAHWSGASSSGSGVATAAGLCYGSLGSDTGGSIRFPSAANGVTGLKPTWGRVSRYGVFELAALLDHVGPMTRNAVDAAAMLGVIAGPDEADPTASQAGVANYLAGIRFGLRGLRVGIDPSFTARIDKPSAAALTAAIDVLASLGPEVVEVRFPDAEQVVCDWYLNCAVQTAVAHRDTYPQRKGEYGPALAALIEAGNQMSGPDYQTILLNAEAFRGQVQALFEQVDIVAAPVQPFASPTIAALEMLGRDPDMLRQLLSFTCPTDVSRNPTLTLPCGMTEHATPLAFQLIGRHFEEALLLRAGYAFQQATDWHQVHPTFKEETAHA